MLGHSSQWLLLSEPDQLQCLFMRLRIPRIFSMISQKNIWMGLSSCYDVSHFQRLLASRAHDFLLASTLRSCHLCRLEYFYRSGHQKLCPSFVEKLLLHWLGRMAYCDIRKPLYVWWMLSAPNLGYPFWSGCIQRRHPWTTIAGALPWHR